MVVMEQRRIKRIITRITIGECKTATFETADR